MMKQLVFKWVLVFLAINLWTCQLYAENEIPTLKQITKRKDFTKTIKEEFQISAAGEVAVHNKYGEVNVKVWDQNKVKIVVHITVNARNENDAQAVFDRIDIDFSNGSSFVKAETSIESQKKSWSWWGGSDKHDYTIDYEVHMPRTGELEVHNKYGNTFVEEIDNKVSLEVKYGNFRLDAARELDVYLGYGNGTVVKSGDTRAVISYSKFRLKEAQDLDVESKYSKIYLDKGNDVNSESKYDTYSLGTIGDFTNNGKYDNIEIASVRNLNTFSKYSNFVIENVKNSAIFELQHGGVRIDRLEKGFSKVRINSKYTDFKIFIAQGASYEVDIETTYASIYYPDALNVTYEMSKSSNHTLEGYMGNKGSGGKIKARLSYGAIKIK